jgi:adenylate cyclase
MPGRAHLTIVRQPPPRGGLERNLLGWKAIASYLNREVRTVQRWEKAEELPVHRQLHVKLSTVHAVSTELDRWLSRRRSLANRPLSKSLAVRYLTDLNNAQAHDCFCDGMIEDLITSLAKLQGIQVLPASTMWSVRNRSSSAVSLGRRFRASHVLDGSMRRTGNRLRLNLHLIETRRGQCLWAERYDRTVEDVFAIQDEIVQSITAALWPALSGQQSPVARSFPTENAQAYALYLQGRQMFHQFRQKNFQRARDMFASAVRMDPAFALAYAGLADCHSYLYLYWEATAANLNGSQSASRKALALAPQLAEAHTSRAVALSTRQRYPEAEKEFQTALSLDPSLFEAHYFYGRACLAQGKLKKATQLLQTAAKVRPEDYQSLCLLGGAYSGLGLKVEAAAAYSQALKVVKQRLEVVPGDARALYLGAIAWARLGEGKKALDWAGRALALDPRDSAVLYNVACLYAVLGRTDEALDCLKRVVRSGWRKEWIKNDSDLASLRENKVFLALVN